MKILKFIKNKYKKTISVQQFADVLRYGFQKMKGSHNNFYKILSKHEIEINQEELMKFDWELSIFDMFVLTYGCRLLLTNKETCDVILDLFHGFVYDDFLKIDAMLAYTFQEESKIRYTSYFEILRHFPIKKTLKETIPTSENQIYLLSNELAKNIYGKKVYDAVLLYTLSTYVSGTLTFYLKTIINISREHDIALKRGC